MKRLIVRGGYPLQGIIDIHGAKNSILPILAASLLCQDRCVIARCPDISDVRAALEILRHLGAETECTGGVVVVDTKNASATDIPEALMAKMRASVTFLGALLGRNGRGELSLPGGCALGERPINYHIDALKTLGVTLEECGTRLHFSWPHPHGGEVRLPFPSVGATENLVMAAVSIADDTVIYNAAREPEVADLCGFLNAMGADIRGMGTDTLYIRGGKTLAAATYSVLPDRIETATYLAMTAACGGNILLRHTDPKLLEPVLQTLERAGCRIRRGEKTVELASLGRLQGGMTVTTEAYPGFPTDAQAPVMAALLQARGEVRFQETVFCQRFQHVPELRKFGAHITTQGCTAVVRGVDRLIPAVALATDLRGGAGVLTAALQAEGESEIHRAELICRGYADLTRGLRSLGARITEGN